MVPNVVTANARFDDCLPETHRRRVQVHGLWSYRISAPLSFDDAAVIPVYVEYGRTSAIMTFVYRLSLIGCLVSEGEVR